MCYSTYKSHFHSGTSHHHRNKGTRKQWPGWTWNQLWSDLGPDLFSQSCRFMFRLRRNSQVFVFEVWRKLIESKPSWLACWGLSPQREHVQMMGIDYSLLPKWATLETTWVSTLAPPFTSCEFTCESQPSWLSHWWRWHQPHKALRRLDLWDNNKMCLFRIALKGDHHLVLSHPGPGMMTPAGVFSCCSTLSGKFPASCLKRL